MKNNYALLLILIFPLFSFSQGKSFWKKTDASRFQQSQLSERNSTLSKYDVYNLNIDDLKSVLKNAVNRRSNSPSNLILQFPNAVGELENYEIYNASILEPEFAAKHPEIQSYVGVNIDNPGTTIRFSTTTLGFHAVIHGIGNTYYIDPFSKDLKNYVFYAKKHLTSEEERLKCLITENQDSNYRVEPMDGSTQRSANDGILRTFRLALASTQEYSNFHINASPQNETTDAQRRATVLAAMNITMTRVNAIFERDVSLTMTLVDNTNIIFLSEDDGLTNDSAGALINEIQPIIDNNIGSANYDIGHVFSTSFGGVASLGGICFSNTKARAVTGLPNPVGDPFDVDFVAHEMGHHYGANHTFNGGQGNCAGNPRNAATAVEPGSGSTIMGYANICLGDNVQQSSDDHFHAVSIAEMWARITSTTQLTCSTNTANGNSAPTAIAGQDFTIPFGTAFTLSGGGNDPDGGAVSYIWEQINPGTDRSQPNTTSTSNPQFRSFTPTASPDRTFPQLNDILNDNLTPQWEVIPNVARVMDFSLTVRDNQSPNGGQTNRDDMRVTTANTGPFVVTSPSTTNESFPSGSTHTITWDVAGTNVNGINTSNVNILLSTDGGQNFDTVLATNTPNDGSENISYPIVNEPFCRIKIEPVGNIYFAISRSFSIGANVVVNEVCNTYNSAVANSPIPDNTSNTSIPITVSETTAVTDLRVSVDVTHTFVGDLFLQLQDPSGNFTNVWNFNCGDFQDIVATFKDGEPAIQCGSPTAGTFAPAFSMADFNGENPSGQWRMFAADRAPNDTGIFNQWSIELCTTTTSIVLDTENFELDDFALYPNPNKGEFNLQFNSNSGQNIDVTIYDISGKLVHTKTYDATPRFNQSISLNNVSSGLYIMNVSDGNKTITKKLIIE